LRGKDGEGCDLGAPLSDGRKTNCACAADFRRRMRGWHSWRHVTSRDGHTISIWRRPTTGSLLLWRECNQQHDSLQRDG